MTQQEWQKAWETWKQVHTIVILSKKLQEANPEKTLFDINTVRGKIVTEKR